MEHKKGQLSTYINGGISGRDYLPYVSKDSAIAEVSIATIVIGVICILFFAISNVYLALKVGLTIGAGVPAAILGVGLLKLLKENTLLKSNMIQSMASIGESVAGGIVFTLVAVLLWGEDFDFLRMTVIATIGAFLGLALIIPFRRYLLVEEHGDLRFPESIAISEVLVQASEGEEKGFKNLIHGAITGITFKLFAGLGFLRESVSFPLNRTALGFELYPSLMALGYIVGAKISSYLFAGGLTAWFVIIPAIYFFSGGQTAPLPPATSLIGAMSAGEVWNAYIRYIGAGAVAGAGFLSLAQNLPSIFRSFKEAIQGQRAMAKNTDYSGSVQRSEQEFSFRWVLAIVIACFLLLWLSPLFYSNFFLALITVFFTFFFAVVSGRMVGILGVSNNPISGMTIASLLVISSILAAMGQINQEAMIAAITFAGVICVGIAAAGGYAQSLKVGFLIGGTSSKMSFYMMLGAIFGVVGSMLTVLLIHEAYTIGSAAAPAPQANLMKIIIEGVMGGNLPWDLILMGAALALVVSLLGIPALIFAVGLYLPISLSASIFIGGLIALIAQRLIARKEELAQKEGESQGIVFASGVIGGDALGGVLIAALVAAGVNLSSIGESIPFLTSAAGEVISFAIFLGIGVLIVRKVLIFAKQGS